MPKSTFSVIIRNALTRVDARHHTALQRRRETPKDNASIEPDTSPRAGRSTRTGGRPEAKIARDVVLASRRNFFWRTTWSRASLHKPSCQCLGGRLHRRNPARGRSSTCKTRRIQIKIGWAGLLRALSLPRGIPAPLSAAHCTSTRTNPCRLVGHKVGPGLVKSSERCCIQERAVGKNVVVVPVKTFRSPVIHYTAFSTVGLSEEKGPRRHLQRGANRRRGKRSTSARAG